MYIRDKYIYMRDKYVYICDKYVLKCICFKYIYIYLCKYIYNRSNYIKKKIPCGFAYDR